MRGNKHTYRHPGWEILLRNKSLKQTHTLDLAGKDQSINSGFRTKRPHNRLKLPLVFPWFRHFSPILIRINKQLAFHSKHKTSKWRYSANISVPLVPQPAVQAHFLVDERWFIIRVFSRDETVTTFVSTFSQHLSRADVTLRPFNTPQTLKC